MEVMICPPVRQFFKGRAANPGPLLTLLSPDISDVGNCSLVITIDWYWKWYLELELGRDIQDELQVFGCLCVHGQLGLRR